jgi:translation initiation factor 3 subunit B
MLTKDEQKAIRKNLREYSRQFDEEDEMELHTQNKEVVEARKRLLDEWLAWRERVEKELQRAREEVGWVAPRQEASEEDAVVEEIVEEVIAETEEIVE